MSKQPGMGDNLYLDGIDLSGDTGDISDIGGGPNPLEITGIDKEGFERQGGLIDGRINWSSWFNPTNAHAELSQLPTGNRLITYSRGTSLGAPAASLQAKQLNYDPTRNQDGSLSIALQAQANEYGTDWGNRLTNGIRTDSEATDGTGVDYGIGTPEHGLQAWLQVFAFTGTDVTVTLEHSDDDGDADAYTAITGAVFSQITGGAPLAERIETGRSLPIKRWIRAVTSTSGGFTDLQFAVAATRNIVAVTF